MYKAPNASPIPVWDSRKLENIITIIMIQYLGFSNEIPNVGGIIFHGFQVWRIPPKYTQSILYFNNSLVPLYLLPQIRWKNYLLSIMGVCTWKSSLFMSYDFEYANVLSLDSPSLQVFPLAKLGNICPLRELEIMRKLWVLICLDTRFLIGLWCISMLISNLCP